MYISMIQRLGRDGANASTYLAEMGEKMGQKIRRLDKEWMGKMQDGRDVGTTTP